MTLSSLALETEQIALNSNKMTALAFQRVKFIGIESEFFIDKTPDQVEGMFSGCKITSEAGKNLCELVGLPYPSIDEAFGSIQHVEDVLGKRAYFVPFRPIVFQHNAGKWSAGPRYDALKHALEMIRPGHRNLVDKMTDHAALQVNCSGQFDPFGEEGALLMNYINNAGPYIAHQIHKELGYGFGHLAIWQGFAEPERLPSATRWFADASDMIACIESLTPLFEVSSLGGCTVESNRKQSIHNMTDLSCMWLLGRPKVSDLGDRYAELRLAPAMPARQGRHVAEVLIDLTEIVLDWFWGLNGGRPVRTLEDAVDLYSFVSDQSCVSEYVPRKPLDEKKWCEMLNEG